MDNEFPPTTHESNTAVAVGNAARAIHESMLQQGGTLSAIYDELTLIRQTLQKLVEVVGEQNTAK